jgi:ketosteroid isomerase-like protein
VDPKEQAIRRVAAARRRGDFDAVRALLADDIVWHEPGAADYSGDHRGGDVVVALMKKLAEITDRTFVLEPQELLVTETHAVARTRWWAERGGLRVEGNEIGVYRFADGRIAEAWFWYDGYDPAAHDVVFSYEPAAS